MFKFLKNKLKGTISKFSKKIEEEKPKEETEEKTQIKEKEQIIEDKKEYSKEKEEPIIEKASKEKETTEERKIEEEKTIEKERVIKTEEEPKEITIPDPKKFQEQLEEEFKEDLTEVAKEKKPVIEEKEDPLEQEQIKKEKEDILEEAKKPIEEPEKKKGFFSKFTEKITTTKISQEKFENLFSDLELILLENNVALEVIEKIKDDLKENIVDKPIKRTKVEETIKDSLRWSIEDLFAVDKVNLLESVKDKGKKPFVIAFLGINGSGKTTSVAKIANMLKQNNISCVLAAADTFRAASIEQLQHHANNLGVKIIKHDYGSDPAAVAFDAIKHAEAKNIDVVLIDTAGRLHTQSNLVEEMKKIIKVSNPDLKIFVGESITGNDCVEQAKNFNEAVGIGGLILSKADVDEKGGAAISVSYITKKPIMYLGVGQELSDLKEFDPMLIVDGLGL